MSKNYRPHWLKVKLSDKEMKFVRWAMDRRNNKDAQGGHIDHGIDQAMPTKMALNELIGGAGEYGIQYILLGREWLPYDDHPDGGIDERRAVRGETLEYKNVHPIRGQMGETLYGFGPHLFPKADRVIVAKPTENPAFFSIIGSITKAKIESNHVHYENGRGLGMKFGYRTGNADKCPHCGSPWKFGQPWVNESAIDPIERWLRVAFPDRLTDFERMRDSNGITTLTSSPPEYERTSFESAQVRVRIEEFNHV